MESCVLKTPCWIQVWCRKTGTGGLKYRKSVKFYVSKVGSSGFSDLNKVVVEFSDFTVDPQTL